MYRDIGVQYIRGSVAESSERTYASGFRSWTKFRGLTSAVLYFSEDTPKSDMVWALVDFAAWCCASEGNKVGTIKSKIAAVQYFHRVKIGMELPTKSPLLERVFSGISRAHAVAGTEKRVRRPVSWEMLLDGETLIPSWGSGGRILWLCLALGYFLMTRSDELFATDAGVAHQVHCMTRGDVAFYSGGEQLPFLRWREARTVEIRFRGHKGDQLQAGNVLVRTRDAVRGLGSSLREGGGAVALLVELLSIHPNLPSSAPLASFRESGRVAVWSYGQALRALREVVAKSRQDPAEFALHSLRIGGASRLAAGGGVVRTGNTERREVEIGCV